jgi:hypothetical protein
VPPGEGVGVGDDLGDERVDVASVGVVVDQCGRCVPPNTRFQSDRNAVGRLRREPRRIRQTGSPPRIPTVDRSVDAPAFCRRTTRRTAIGAPDAARRRFWSGT